jgi:uncharacterized membrane protein
VLLQSTETFWLWQFLARLHPLLVHFPIGLLCVALLLEVIDWKKKSEKLREATHILTWIGAVSAVFTVIFGLMLANQEESAGTNLEIHRWAGIGTMVLSLAALLSLRLKNRISYRSLLTVTVLGVSLAGHYGAMITHGDDYLSSTLPFGNEAEPQAAENPNFSFANLGSDATLTPKQVEDLNLEVRTILAHNCYSCHGEAKMKGELRLDKKEFVFKGGEDGPVIVPGNPGKSELIRRITLPTGHKEAMPVKGKRLNEAEIALLKFWIEKGAPYPDHEKSIYRVAEMAPRLPEIPAATGDLLQPLDRFVNVYYQKHQTQWAPAVNDRLYIRRVYLDVIGLLPTPEDVEAYVNNASPDKQRMLVRSLLSRNDDYAQHWLTFWNDALRNDYSGTGYITKGRYDITKWLYASLQSNKPYNWFVKELISPNSESEGFIKGIKWRGTINASQRVEMQAAQNVSQVFLGLNLKCASCHDSFISDWKLDDAYAFANIFADTTLEVNRCDKPTGKMAGRRILFKELGEIDVDAPTEQRLRQLADFLVQPKDGRLYRTLVNRIWAQVMGRGIIEPVDVMDNIPWDADLLDWLASDFVANGYDVKRLIEQILVSKTYQQPSVSVKEAGDLMSGGFQFKGMIRRRLTAEQFADAVSTTFSPVYSDSALATKLLPENIKSEIPFPRASLVKNDPFLTALGRPNRETVSTGRMSQANLLQALELTNGSKFTATLKAGAKKWKMEYPATVPLVTNLYKKAYGRQPQPQELAIAQKILGEKPSEEAIQDLVWAVTLSPEFQLIF